MLLVVDCCVRGADSATRRYYESYLQTVPQREVSVVRLSELPLVPFDAGLLAQREALCAEKQFSHGLFKLAWQFREAEELLIAAPFWDLSFPSLLKIYLEWIMVNGLTFGYEQDGRCVGYCKAERLLYFSTCGGYVGRRHLGFEYVKALADMLGVKTCVPYILEGLDIDPSQRESMLARAIQALSSQKSS